MIQRESIRFKIAWISLAIVGIAILVFGLIVAVWPGSSNALFLRTIGVASIGMGLFGLMITVIPYKRRERWAWFTLWYYPIFLLEHFLGGLPPGASVRRKRLELADRRSISLKTANSDRTSH